MRREKREKNMYPVFVYPFLNGNTQKIESWGHLNNKIW